MDIETMLDDCNEAKTARNSPFTPWEKEFIESVSEQFDERHTLSDKQTETLENIWNKI